MTVKFIETIEGLFENSYKELGVKEMNILPEKGDIIQRNGSRWRVGLKRFMFDTDDGDYVLVFMIPIDRKKNKK